jgi:hypothetical protein
MLLLVPDIVPFETFCVALGIGNIETAKKVAYP